VVFQPTPVRKPDGLWVVVVEAIRKELVDDALGLPSEYPLRSTRTATTLSAREGLGMSMRKALAKRRRLT